MAARAPSDGGGVTGGAASLRPAAIRAAGRAVGLGVDPARAHEVELAVHEALANALEHAHGGRVGHPIGVTVFRDDVGHVVVRVTDDGPDDGPDPSSRGGVERGRGRALMRSLCDHLVIERHGRGTRVDLAWHRSPLAEVTPDLRGVVDDTVHHDARGRTR